MSHAVFLTQYLSRNIYHAILSKAVFLTQYYVQFFINSTDFMSNQETVELGRGNTAVVGDVLQTIVGYSYIVINAVSTDFRRFVLDLEITYQSITQESSVYRDRTRSVCGEDGMFMK